MSKTVDYYFSPVSPWTYLGHAPFRALTGKHGVSINVKPCDLAGKIFPVSGGLPLKQRAPQRQAYRLVELRRWREVRNVPLHLEPKHFPVDPERAARLIVAAATQGQEAAMTLAGAMLRACWAEERNIADPPALRAILQEQRMNADALFERAEGDAAKAAYEANTQEAIERGVFGAPTYVYEGELFWGQDRLDFLERALQR
jgi:carboxymethylenebutenolidase